MKALKILFIFLLPSILFPNLISAHALRLSNSELQWSSSQIDWTLQVHLTDFNQKLQNVEESVVKDYIAKRIEITQGNTPCHLSQMNLSKELAQEFVRIHLLYQCPVKASELHISYGLFYGDLNHQHLLKVIQNGKVFSYTFSPENSEADFSIQSNLWEEIKSFFKLGLEHILTGYDHLLFILSLMLGARRFKDLFWLATTFTIAHSISLSLAAFDILTLSSRIVEPLIAASIVFVALRNFFKSERSDSKTQLLMVFLFGLIHGLGFSGALKEAQLESTSLAVPLLCFNLGVESGQILMIGTVYPFLRLLQKKRKPAYLKGKRVALILIALAGGYWMIERIFF